MGQESSHSIVDESVPPQKLSSRTIQAVADFINEGKAQNICVLTGAGLSTSAGIPDFRSPDTGLYANLARLNLPYAEAVFDISYFREHPEPFYTLARELYPGKYKPTIGHAFIALLAQKGLLKMLFTQNIDCLERAAGVPDEKIVEAHGSFATQRCIECKDTYPDDLMKKAVLAGDVPHCLKSECDGLVKPDIVFFGESLPQRFNDLKFMPATADLVIIMGTSLTVQPFATLPQLVAEDTPRVLINLERVGGLGSRLDDVCVLSDIDSGVRKLADALGWRDELEEHWKSVSGSEGVTAEEAAAKTPDEALEDEIEKLTKGIDETLGLSSSHTQWTTEQLQKDQEERQKKEKKAEPEVSVKTQEENENSKAATVEQSKPTENAEVSSTTLESGKPAIDVSNTGSTAK